MMETNTLNSLENQPNLHNRPAADAAAAVRTSRPSVVSAAASMAETLASRLDPPPVALHPLSNTGCITPSSTGADPLPPVLFHLDYLRLTVHASVFSTRRDVAECLMWLLSEKVWPRFSANDLSEWVNAGPGGHWAERWKLLPGVTICVPRDDDARWVSLELSGEAFTWCSSADLREFMAWIERAVGEGIIGKFKATRVDLALDHVQISPLEMRGWIEAGSARSKGFARCKNGKPDHRWFENGDGSTCYLQAGPRLVRLYDRRGYNRLELQLEEQHAAECFGDLWHLPADQWAVHAVARLRGFVDFVDPSSSPRIERAALLPKWADLVQHTTPARLRPRERVESSATPAGRFNVRSQRMQKTLAQILHAFGEEKFQRYCMNLARSGAEKLEPLDRLDAEALRSWEHFVDHLRDNDDPDGDLGKLPPPF